MRILRVLTSVAVVFLVGSVQAGIVIIEPRFNEVRIQLHGDVDQGITFV